MSTNERVLEIRINVACLIDTEVSLDLLADAQVHLQHSARDKHLGQGGRGPNLKRVRPIGGHERLVADGGDGSLRILLGGGGEERRLAQLGELRRHVHGDL